MGKKRKTAKADKTQVLTAIINLISALLNLLAKILK